MIADAEDLRAFSEHLKEMTRFCTFLGRLESI